MVYLLFLKKLVHRTFFVDKFVLVGHTIFATGHLKYVVTTIDKPIAIRANAYESMKEISNAISRIGKKFGWMVCTPEPNLS